MTGDTPALETRGLTKFYGDVRGVEGLDLLVERGQVFGFLGPNGAGKTTTIRLLLDLIRPTSGSAQVLGLDVGRDSLQARRSIGYLPGELALYENLTGEGLLEHFASLRGRIELKRARDIAERLDLDLTRRIRDLSRGNKQKVGVVQAFMHDPDLLILDEPTSGLDPLMQHEFGRLVRETAAEGRTVFLSSHVLSETESVADRVGIIRAGRLVVVENVAALKAKAVRRMEFHFARPPDPQQFEGIRGVREWSLDDTVGHFVVEGTVDPLLKVAAQHEILDLVSHEPDLEEIFLTYYEGEDDD